MAPILKLEDQMPASHWLKAWSKVNFTIEGNISCYYSTINISLLRLDPFLFRNFLNPLFTLVMSSTFLILKVKLTDIIV